MLLFGLIVLLYIWGPNIQKINGKWVNVKKNTSGNTLKSIINLSTIARLTLTLLNVMMNAGKRISEKTKTKIKTLETLGLAVIRK